ncbi:hypothetical protein SKAU_G00310580 [Synaphobranchus kaupii]|uniref:Uncharacterized protein n=1 Tax=Synaphobranchus kaupii TaxID=118154 RepID=A0A9Q1ERJ0_SYNKA|nr:hypothetical protein SKAU_G00310580 [Synaphobranchus kaupii]
MGRGRLGTQTDDRALGLGERAKCSRILHSSIEHHAASPRPEVGDVDRQRGREKGPERGEGTQAAGRVSETLITVTSCQGRGLCCVKPVQPGAFKTGPQKDVRSHDLTGNRCASGELSARRRPDARRWNAPVPPHQPRTPPCTRTPTSSFCSFCRARRGRTDTVSLLAEAHRWAPWTFPVRGQVSGVSFPQGRACADDGEEPVNGSNRKMSLSRQSLSSLPADPQH